MADDGEKTDKFIILSVKEGFGFTYLKNRLIRILATFKQTTFFSEYKFSSSTPTFKCNFSWCVDNTFLKTLQELRASVTIEIQSLDKDQQERSVGYVKIGLHRAELLTDSQPRYQAFELQNAKLPFGVKTPQLFVSFSIQNSVRVGANEESYSSQLDNSSQLDKVKPKKVYDIKPQLSIKKISDNMESKGAIPKSLNKRTQRRTDFDSSDDTESTVTSRSNVVHYTSEPNVRSDSHVPKEGPPTSTLQSDLNSVSAPYLPPIPLPPESYSSQLDNSSQLDKVKPKKVCDIKPQLSIKKISDNMESKGAIPKSLNKRTQRRTDFDSSDDTESTVTSRSNVVHHTSESNVRSDSRVPKEGPPTSTLQSDLNSVSAPYLPPIPLPPLLEDYTDVSTVEEFQDISSSYHRYKVNLVIESVKWYKMVKSTRVLIGLYNPSNQSLVTSDTATEYYVPNLIINDVICSLFYTCVPEDLSKTVKNFPPYILISKESNSKLIAKGVLQTSNQRDNCEFEFFGSTIPLIGKNMETMGKMLVFVTFEDLGLTIDSFECTIKCKNSRRENIPLDNLAADMKNLLKVHQDLRDTHDKMQECFSKFHNTYIITSKINEQQQANDEATQQMEDANVTSAANPCTDRPVVVDCFNRMGQPRNPKLLKKNRVNPTKDGCLLLNQSQRKHKDTHVVTAKGTHKPKGIAVAGCSKDKDVESDESYCVRITERIAWCTVCGEFHCVQESNESSSTVKDAEQLKGDLSQNTNVPETETKEEDNNVCSQPFKETCQKPPKKTQSATGTCVRNIQDDETTTSTKGVQTTNPKFISKARRMSYVPTSPVTVIKRRCEGCGEYIEVGYGKNVWQDNQLTFWCKDCSISKLQSQLRDTIESCTSEINAFKRQTENLQDQYIRHLAEDKEKCNNLTTSKHDLNILVIQAQHQNAHLDLKCQKLAQELDALKLIVPVNRPITVSDRPQVNILRDESQQVTELKQEISEYTRDLESFTQSETTEQPVIVKKVQKSRSSVPKFVGSRKDRCEGCQAIEKRDKGSKPNDKTKETVELPSTSQSQQSKTGSISKMSDSEISDRMLIVRTNLRMHVQERSQLTTTNTYPASHPVIVHMTSTINKLLYESDALRRELEKRSYL